MKSERYAVGVPSVFPDIDFKPTGVDFKIDMKISAIQVVVEEKRGNSWGLASTTFAIIIDDTLPDGIVQDEKDHVDSTHRHYCLHTIVEAVEGGVFREYDAKLGLSGPWCYPHKTNSTVRLSHRRFVVWANYDTAANLADLAGRKAIDRRTWDRE